MHRSVCLIAIALGVLAGCSSAPEESTARSASSALSAGQTLETFEGVTAYVYGGDCTDVYATSGANAHYGPPGVRTDTCGFQCVELAVRFFDFKEGIPASGWAVPAAIDMCASHPQGVVETIHPVAGDLMVYDANDGYYGTGPAGHVAVIRSVNAGGSLDVFNQRWGNETTAFVDGILPSHAACFLHSVRGPGGGGGAASACSGVAAVNGGVYCGSSRQSGFAGGSPTTLYTCTDGAVSSTRSCTEGCYVAPAGQNDGCYGDPCTRVAAGAQGKYCGASRENGFVGGSGELVYDCEGARTRSVETCASGCFVAPPGTPDGCR